MMGKPCRCRKGAPGRSAAGAREEGRRLVVVGWGQRAECQRDLSPLMCTDRGPVGRA